MVDEAAKPLWFTPAVIYKDPKAALAWLETAFGFEPDMVISNAEGVIEHAQMRHGEGTIMVGGEWSSDHRSPASVGRICTQSIHVHVAADIDGHCARARAAGAEILSEPTDQFYGDRTYRARDPEGHIWTFGQPQRVVSRADAEAATGYKIVSKSWA